MSLPTTRKQALEEGAALYDTGVVCKNNHGSIRYASNGYCCICSNINLIKWREKNNEKIRAYKAWYKSTPSGRSLHSKNQQDREAKKIKSSLYAGQEFNDFCLEEAYHLAFIRTKNLSIKFHVDHIVPLRGKNVCGFHSWNNVQVIPASQNIKKSNLLIGV